MKKKSLLVFSLVLFVACGSSSSFSIDTKKIPLEVSQNDFTYRFYYPEKAELFGPVGIEGSFDLAAYSDDCAGIDFGDMDKIKKLARSWLDKQDEEVSKADNDENIYESWFWDGELVFYAKYLKESNFGFFAFDQAKNVQDCMPFVDDLFESLSSDQVYENKEFAYRVILPPSFKIKYLDNGLLMKSWIEPKDGEDFEPHKIEIVVWPIENFDKDQDLATFVAKKYSGFSLEGKDFSGFSGYFVDESSLTMEAKRHFFTINEDKTIIYEAYLQVQSKYYPRHRDFFDKFVENNFKLL